MPRVIQVQAQNSVASHSSQIRKLSTGGKLGPTEVWGRGRAWTRRGTSRRVQHYVSFRALMSSSVATSHMCQLKLNFIKIFFNV